MTNHLWQSTLFALAAALLALALRKNRAHVRYWLLFSASLKFFIPFALLIGLGTQLHWPKAAQKIAAPKLSYVTTELAEPFQDAPAPLAPHVRSWETTALMILWACGFAAIAIIRLRAWKTLQAAVRASSPIVIPAPVEIRATPSLMEPGVYGLFRPILLLPEDIKDRLAPAELEAVLAHELCHVHRRDNLTSAIHMLVEAVFWFHPLVWWIGARLVEERERACDEEVVRQGSEPHVYAEAILNVCKNYVESRLPCAAGVSGSDLKKRIQAILSGAIGGNLSLAKKLALTSAAIIAIALPIFVGGLRAQSPVPKFEVASIRNCKAGELAGGARGAKGGRGGGTPQSSPDTLYLPCLPPKLFIQMATIDFADGKWGQQQDLRLEGGPDWITNERYAINAKAEGIPGQQMMRGPMLQALLEDRFQLKIHRETREIPLYALTVAKGGIKFQHTVDGTCAPRDRTKFPPPPLDPDHPPCAIRILKSLANSSWSLDGIGATMTDLSHMLGNSAGRPVIDRTGLTGMFDFKLNYTPEGDADTPSMFTALQDLGLKLEPIKGPRDFLVIDHIEKPSEN